MNFADLAEAYPPLKPHVFLRQGAPAVDFKDANAQRRLTEAILHRDFNLTLTLPDTRLCPAVPNRLDYVLWIHDILANTYDVDPSAVRGIDIGTGASVIYVLLACRLYDTWSMIGTDVDEISLHYARENVTRNGLQDRIEIMTVDPEGLILQPLAAYPEIQFDFTMCNPPFYASAAEISDLAEMKEFDPNGVCTGSANEMIIAGGEVAFVSRMVNESTQFGSRCRWYTSLIGKLSSVKEIVELFRKQKITNYALGEVTQGRTKRWAVAWSFGDARLSDDVGRPSAFALKSLVPLSNTFTHRLPTNLPPLLLVDVIREVAQSVSGLELSPDSSILPFIATARRNTWSRAARRQQTRGMATDDGTPAAHLTIILQARISVRDAAETSSAGVLKMDWTIGKDRAVVESFCNHFARKVDELARDMENREGSTGHI